MGVRRNIRLLAWFNFMLDFRLYSPVAILYFSQVTGSFSLGMSIFSMIMFSSALLEVPTGIISDRMGRKRTLVWGAVASTASVAFYAIGGGYAALLIGAGLEGLSRALFSGNNTALLYDTLRQIDSSQQYQDSLGKTSAMFQVALATASLVGGIIAAVSYPAVMWLSVIPQGIGIMLALRMVEPQVHSPRSTNVYQHLRESLKGIIRNPRLRALSAASIIGYAFSESAWEFRPTFFQLIWPPWLIGAARTISNVGAAFSFYLAGRIIRRFGERRLIMSGIALSETSNLLAVVFAGPFSPLLIGATSVYFGVTMVSINGLMQTEFTHAQRATMGSLNALGGSLGFAICSLALGALADRIGVIPALIIVTLLNYLPLWWYRQAFRAPSTVAQNQDPA
ncbi:MAG: MFS transporter [Anaerolinea sp.]|nr:MFS transporter [Anaerolinea sp.]